MSDAQDTTDSPPTDLMSVANSEEREEQIRRKALLTDIASLPVRSPLPESGASILQRVIHELGEFHPAVPPYYCTPIKNYCAHWSNRIARALQHIRLAGWQSIETAPKDGTLIDVWLGDADADEVEFYCTRGTKRSPGWAWRGDRFRPAGGLQITTFVKPTHWMPLPALPPETGS